MGNCHSSKPREYRIETRGGSVLGTSCSLDSCKKRASVMYVEHGEIRVYFKDKYMGCYADSHWVPAIMKTGRGVQR